MLFVVHHLPEEGDSDCGEYQLRTTRQLRLDDATPEIVQNQVSTLGEIALGHLAKVKFCFQPERVLQED